MKPCVNPNPVPDLRGLSTEELVNLGNESLRDHLAAQAVVAHHKYSPLGFEKLEAFLNDPECVRYPTRLVYEFGDMAPHQFAQPDIDWRSSESSGPGRVLYLRPILAQPANREMILHAVAYMVPVINYGEVVTDALCLHYGATLLGLMEDEFYERICAVADTVGAEFRQACVP